MIALFSLWAFAFGCGGGGGPMLAFPAPFNTAKGEGNLLSHSLVETYPTATSDASPGLDALYTAGICTGLSTTQCAANQASLDTPLFGNFNLAADPIGNNPLGIKLIDAIKIDYTAIGLDGSADTVSGGILVPEVAPASLKGLILYFHGTTAQRSNVPSNFSTVANPTANDPQGILLAAIWASQGYIVVMPDYLGLGDDLAHPHPYVLYPAENAQSGLAMVDAARTLLSDSYGITGPLPLFLTGYSEGGGYALQSEHMMQNNPLYAQVLDVDLKKAVPLSGAFDLTGTMLPFLFDNVTTAHNNWFSLSPTTTGLAKPYLTAYLGTSFAFYSNVVPTDLFVSTFYNCATTSACVGSPNLTALYFASPLSDGPLAGADDLITVLTYNQAALAGYNVDNNPITSVLTSAYVTALMNKDTTNLLYQLALTANTYQFVPSVPVTLVSLMEDSVVTRKNTDVAFSFFEQSNPSGPYKEDLVNNTDFSVLGLTTVGPIDHTSELPFLSVLILNEFNTAT
jgi:Secretory lipase